MTEAVSPAARARPHEAGSWPLWRRQVFAILRLEIFKNFFGKRALPMYLLASLPILLMVIYFLAPIPPESRGSVTEATVAFANIHNAFIVRALVFIGCVLIFTNLFRGEIVEQSLHYYFLVPVRREVLVVGKFLAGLLSTAIIFSISTAVAYVLMVMAHGTEDATRHLISGPGGAHLLAYIAVTAIACLGYGPVFLLTGLLFRNPIIPALFIWGWEWLNFLLPALLKKISVIHYLQSLAPVPIDEGPLAVIAEPTSVWVAVPGLIVVAAALLYLSSWVIRRMEIRYGAD